MRLCSGLVSNIFDNRASGSRGIKIRSSWLYTVSFETKSPMVVPVDRCALNNTARRLARTVGGESVFFAAWILLQATEVIQGKPDVLNRRSSLRLSSELRPFHLEDHELW